MATKANTTAKPAKPAATNAFPRIMTELEMPDTKGSDTLTNVLWGFGALRAKGKHTDCKLVCRFTKNESQPVKVGCRPGRDQFRKVADDADLAILEELWKAEDRATATIKKLKEKAADVAWRFQGKPMTDRYTIKLDLEIEKL